MRITLTLDADVAALLKRVLTGRNQRVQVVVDEALRQGLGLLGAAPEQKAAYRTPSVDTGRCFLPNVDNISQVLAVGEDAWRE